MNPEKKSTYDDENLMRVRLIAGFLKNYRMQFGFTQEQISKYAELNRSTIIRLESGLPVSFLSICKYASALDLNLNQLFLQIE